MEFFILLLAIYCLSTVVVIGKVVYECCQLGFKTNFEMKVCEFRAGLSDDESILKHTSMYVVVGFVCQAFLPIINTYKAFSYVA